MNANERREALELMKSVAEPVLAELSERVTDQVATFGDRIRALEVAKASGNFNHSTTGKADLASHIVKSDNFKAMMAGNGKSCRIDLPGGMLTAQKAAIVSQGQDLSPAMRVPGIVANPLRVKRVRDLLPIGTTAHNLVEFTRENVFTNNAGPQYSSPNTENVTKPESGLTFELKEAPVRTLAHWIPVSKQVLADSQQMQSYINARLMQGLKVKEDLQILAGDGAGANLAGILKAGNYTAAPSAVTGDNRMDRILRAMAAIAVDEMAPDGILLHPNDWADMQTLKASTSGEYLLASPGNATEPNLWGVPVVVSTAITEGSFLVGAWGMGAQLWDREQANVQISFEDGNNFVKNMATILCEERLALTIYRPKAFRYGTGI
jgi:HK97 family phage major capsid protein